LLPVKGRVFRDPVHGLIEFLGEDAALGSILETRAFQRLRRIHQMGLAWLVYVGAEHSRFGHALGAFHVACRVTKSLEMDERQARHVKVAALLHDIGHGPFSHTWEQAFSGADHESWGIRIITEDAELGGVLNAIEPDLPATLKKFWDKSYSPAVARKLVSSQLDVDRLDYLLRDGHFSGAGYATFDLDWILHALQIGSVGERSDLVVDYRRGMYAVEQYLFARSYMYAQVYHHKTVRAAEWMFLKLLSRFADLARTGNEPGHLEVGAALATGEGLTVDQYLWLDDMSITQAVHHWAGLGPNGQAGAAKDELLRDLAQRLASRRLFKTIELGDDPSVGDRIRDRVKEVAEKEYGERAGYYYEIDTAKQVGYSVSDDEEELHVVDHPKYGTVTLGRLMDDLPLGRPTSTTRLVCAPELIGALQPLVDDELAHGRRIAKGKR
jgi:HD superfamily phosphohydrolase